MLLKAEDVVRATRHAWNRAVDTVPGWPKQCLTPPPCKRSSYWLRLEHFPESLQQEIRDDLHRLANPDPFLDTSSNGYAPATVGQFRYTYITLASALVASGVPVEGLMSISTLLRPHNLETALRFLYERAGKHVTVVIHNIARRARTIAAHAGLPEPDLARLDEILTSINRAAPPSRGLATKNRQLLEHLDAPAFVDRLVTLPHRLMQTARKMTDKKHAASYARDAVAVELLLTCSMRLGNLVDLRIGETIRRFGENRGNWVLELRAERVKNKQPLRFTLPAESGELIEEYLATWQSYWAGPGVPWLFPARHGGHVDGRFLSDSIAKRARRFVGERITAHQFRHIAAELYLREDPNGIAIVSQHLGHRDLNTTRLFYAREQTRVATQRYHEVLARQRAAAPKRPRTRKPRIKPA